MNALEAVDSTAQFLNRIGDNSNWMFSVIGDMAVVGKATTVFMKADGEPVSVRVKTNEKRFIEIPWSSIQTIMLITETD